MLKSKIICLNALLWIFVCACNDDNSGGHANKEVETDADTGSASDADTDTDTDADTDTDTDADTDVDTDADSDADTDTDADLDTDSDSANDTGTGDEETDGPFTAYNGFEDVYILTSPDDSTDVCRIRYELRAVGVPSVPCGQCEWAVVVEQLNPSTLLDLEGACANSSLNMDEAAIAAGAGERKEYGYVQKYLGHDPVLMSLNEELGAWEPVVYAAWSAETGELLYNRQDGYCDYEVSTEPGVVKTGTCGFEGEAVVLPQ